MVCFSRLTRYSAAHVQAKHAERAAGKSELSSECSCLNGGQDLGSNTVKKQEEWKQATALCKPV